MNVLTLRLSGHCRPVVSLYLGLVRTLIVQDERKNRLLEFQEILIGRRWWSISPNWSLSFEEQHEEVDIVLQHPLQLAELSCTGPVPLLDRNTYTKGRGISFLLAWVLFRRPIILKNWENIVRLTLKVPLRNQVLLLHSNSIVFWIAKISTQPSTSIWQLSNIKNHSPCSVLWCWSGISSNSSSTLEFTGILQWRVRWKDCHIASHSGR